MPGTQNTDKPKLPVVVKNDKLLDTVCTTSECVVQKLVTLLDKMKVKDGKC